MESRLRGEIQSLNHGFDHFYGSLAGHADYYTHVYDSDMKVHFLRDRQPVDDRGYFDELFTDEAIRVLREKSAAKKPFYLNLCFYAPHGPYQAPPGFYHSDEPATNYRHMIAFWIRASAGAGGADRLRLAESTLVVFLSDQGGSLPTTTAHTAGKQPQGGLQRRLAGSNPRGKTRRDALAAPGRIFRFAALAGASLPGDRTIDAQNVWPLFEGSRAAARPDVLLDVQE